jgi:hypothetical protein
VGGGVGDRSDGGGGAAAAVETGGVRAAAAVSASHAELEMVVVAGVCGEAVGAGREGNLRGGGVGKQRLLPLQKCIRALHLCV